jgi:hypothetical protein
MGMSLKNLREVFKRLKNEKTKERLKTHFVDSAAIITESNPTYAFFEVFVSGLSVRTSLNSNIIASLITLTGIGYLIGKLRDISIKIFKVDEKSEKKMMTHDFLYSFSINFLTAPFIYGFSQYMANENIDIKRIFFASFVAGVVGSFNGVPLCYSIDIFRDLFGIKKCERPFYKSIKIKEENKKKIGYALILSSIATVGLIYGLKKAIE